jgi:hypothetical protein
MQFTHALRVLPAFFLLAQSAGTQTRYRVLNEGEWFHQEANGRRLARLVAGAVVSGAETQGVETQGAEPQRADTQRDWTRVVVEGWIWGESVGATPRAGFDLAVTRAPEENLRATPGGTVVARLAEGFLLTKLGEDGQWVRVRRSGWVRRAGLGPAPAAAAADGGPGPGPPRTGGGAPAADSTPPHAVGDPSRVQPARPTPLYRAPEGPEAGAIARETPVRVLGRSGGGEWTRVQVEGWVKTADLETAPPGVLVGVSAAELRAAPERYAGRVLRWNLQYLATQVSDDLRPDIPPGATYLLARGPLPERGFVYVVVPEAHRSLIETLTPLASLQVTARVRTGRARFIGNPVVELVTLEVTP